MKPKIVRSMIGDLNARSGSQIITHRALAIKTGRGRCPWVCAGSLVECGQTIERPVRGEPMLVSHDKEFLSADSASGNW